MKKLAFAAMMLGAFGLAACGGGDDDDNVSFVDGGSGDGGPGGDACNPVTQMGCDPGEKCTQVVVQEEPTFLARTSCVPDGSVEIGGACTEGAAGVNGGADDCVAGAYCIAMQCKSICSVSPDSCGDGFACSSYVDTFNDITSTDVGVCDTVCNPVTQDCPIETEGCFLSLANLDGEATCSRVPAMAAELTQGDTCYGPDATSCYLNGCAEGYGSFLYQGENMARACTAFCSPVNTYNVDPDGDGEGTPNETADADGLAPNDCAATTIGVADHQCRFFQNFFIDANQMPLAYIPAEYGFCAPADETFGDCEVSSIEQILAIFDAANGGMEGQMAVGTFCDENGAKCASGCTDLATEDGLVEAYCTANPDGPACASGAKGKKVMDAVKQIRAEKAREAGLVNPFLN